LKGPIFRYHYQYDLASHLGKIRTVGVKWLWKRLIEWSKYGITFVLKVAKIIA